MRPLRQSIDDTAAEWIGRRDGGLTPVQESELAAWLGADPRHAASFARLEAGSRALDQAAAFRPTGAAEADPDLPLQSRTRRMAWVPLTLAAAAAVAFAFVGWWRPARTNGSFSSSVATLVGSVQRQTLPDGSVVTLNTDSAMEVVLTAAERRVRLLRGEAIFTVAKNPARPFVVQAADVEVEAVGTEFNVRLRPKAVEVLVTEGKVAIATRTPSLAPRFDSGESKAPLNDGQAGALKPENNGRALVSAGERIVIAAPAAGHRAIEPTKAKAPVNDAEISRLLAWKERRIEFDPEPLVEVAAEFNRYNTRKLIVADPAVAALRVGGSFRADDVETFVRLLETSFGLAAERKPGEIVLRQR